MNKIKSHLFEKRGRAQTKLDVTNEQGAINNHPREGYYSGKYEERKTGVGFTMRNPGLGRGCI